MRALIRWAAEVRLFWRELVLIARCMRHMVPTYRHHTLGRWYVFRDCPQWFVLEMATTPITAKDTPEMARYIREARREMEARLRRNLAAVGEGSMLYGLLQQFTEDAIAHLHDTDNRAARMADTTHGEKR